MSGHCYIENDDRFFHRIGDEIFLFLDLVTSHQLDDHTGHSHIRRKELLTAYSLVTCDQFVFVSDRARDKEGEI